MNSVAKNLRFSPYKMRVYVNSIRGIMLPKAYAWLRSCQTQRAVPLLKTLLSAYSNAKNLDAEITSMDQLRIKEIRVDQGRTTKYFKPGAMGRASAQRRRLCHVSVVLEKR